jgi:hypothetical protein
MLKAITTVVEGFERLPEAIVGLYRGSRVGKLRFSSNHLDRADPHGPSMCRQGDRLTAGRC